MRASGARSGPSRLRRALELFVKRGSTSTRLCDALPRCADLIFIWRNTSDRHHADPRQERAYGAGQPRAGVEPACPPTPTPRSPYSRPSDGRCEPAIASARRGVPLGPDDVDAPDPPSGSSLPRPGSMPEATAAILAAQRLDPQPLGDRRQTRRVGVLSDGEFEERLLLSSGQGRAPDPEEIYILLASRLRGGKSPR